VVPALGTAHWRDYLALTKPRVVALIVLTAIVGTLLATPGLPPLDALLFGNLGIALAAASAAALNHVLDRRIDARMSRTRGRPLPTGALSHRQALAFAALLGVASMLVLTLLVNKLTALLTFASLIGYAVVYTLWLKRATPQNIVIGGAAGAVPPLVGWAAATGRMSVGAAVLFLIVFVWTPPHFWALAMLIKRDYAAAGVPMLPVVRGNAAAARQILVYSLGLVAVTALPAVVGIAGRPYLVVAAAAGAWFIWLAWRVVRDPVPARAGPLFHYSMVYLAVLFVAMAANAA
jgi:protoheme IX farnesyltransferase